MHITASVFINDNESGLHADFDRSILFINHEFYRYSMPKNFSRQTILIPIIVESLTIVLWGSNDDEGNNTDAVNKPEGSQSIVGRSSNQ